MNTLRFARITDELWTPHRTSSLQEMWEVENDKNNAAAQAMNEGLEPYLECIEPNNMIAAHIVIYDLGVRDGNLIQVFTLGLPQWLPGDTVVVWKIAEHSLRAVMQH